MPKFITIGYGDRDGYDRTDAAVRNAAHAHDARLRKAGILMGLAGTPVQVRTLADAVNLVSQTPCAVAHGVVEVWPLNQTA
jgi:hypothetical protein